MSIKERFDLTGKVAIITGASRGIGEAIAYALAEHGARVLVSSRKREAIQSVAEALQQQGHEAYALAANAGNPTELHALVEQTVRHFGRLDVVVNNAAANPVFGAIENTDVAAFDKIMDVNVKGPFELSKAALPHLKAQGGGSIINISSVGGMTPEDGLGVYSVSKAALIMLTKALAKEWGAYNIRVNAICPGLIQTAFSQTLWNNNALMKQYMNILPLHRVGSVEEVSALALFLASAAGGFCTGGVYTADGGHTI
jgi:NAD(P)-dependent dehydrogenase (short-subunit alcohol dehydrogenase family)